MSILTKKQVKTMKKEITYLDNPSIIIVEIRFDDECGNGHNSFAITGEIWTKRRYNAHLKGSETADCETCGMIHDQISKYFKELRPYLKWHNTSTAGPMHYVANSIYWVEQGNLEYARSCAVWPEAQLEDFTKDKLLARLPALMLDFQKDMEALGFIY